MSLIEPPIVTESVASVVIEAQFEMKTFSGRTKSLTSDVNESDERLFRYTDPNWPHCPPPKMASKSITASPNVNALKGPISLLAASPGIAVVFTEPRA